MDKPPPLPTVPPVIPRLTPPERIQLAHAKALLEHPGLAARLANVVGAPIEQGMKLLPRGWQTTVNTASRTALLKALEVAVFSIRSRKAKAPSERFHQLLAGTTGGVGGLFGLSSLAIELPLSTTIMLRSVAEIARSEGHDLHRPETKLACLEVFALGGRSAADDAAESAYWAVRVALAQSVAEAASYLAQKGAADKAAPALLRFVTAVASRFGVVVSEEVAAKAVPVVGAAGGAIINVLFMNHFQDMAHGHFVVKRLEAKYGQALVRQVYETV